MGRTALPRRADRVPWADAPLLGGGYRWEPKAGLLHRDDVRDLDQQEEHEEDDEQAAADDTDSAHVADDVPILLGRASRQQAGSLGAAQAGSGRFASGAIASAPGG